MLQIGVSGAGKTGATCSLASDGYLMRYLDLDNGLDCINNLLTDPKSPYDPEAYKRCKFVTVTEPMKLNPLGIMLPGRATAWDRAMKLLDHWKTEEEDLGPPNSWGEDTVLVIDGLTLLGTSALNKTLAMNNRLGQRPQQSDWYDAQNAVEGMLMKVYDENFKTNVIINCHIKLIGDPKTNIPIVGYPGTLGKSLPPRVGIYFNTILQAAITGQGLHAKRVILTKGDGTVALKNTAPLKVKDSYPLETGLADYFRDVRGSTPKTRIQTA